MADELFSREIQSISLFFIWKGGFCFDSFMVLEIQALPRAQEDSSCIISLIFTPFFPPIIIASSKSYPFTSFTIALRYEGTLHLCQIGQLVVDGHLFVLTARAQDYGSVHAAVAEQLSNHTA